MKKGLLEQVKEDYKKTEENFEYDLLYRIIDLVPHMFREKIRYDDETYKLYIGESEIGTIGEDIGNVVDIDNHIGYYQLRNICELDFIKYDENEAKTETRRLIFNSKEEDTYELKDWTKCEIQSYIVEEVFDDYNKYLYKNTDDDYSAIYNLVDAFEIGWNSQGANLKYTLDIKDESSEEYYLYLENTKICAMEDLMYCEAQVDSIIYHLTDDRLLYIVTQWVEGSDAFISQIYIENKYEDDGSEILYEK